MGASFTITRRVQFAETDMAGVLHFANYFRLMEEVEHGFWRSLGESVFVREGGDRTISWPRVAVRCEYRSPLRFEDELELQFAVTEISTKSACFEVRFRCRGEEMAFGEIKVVCCTVTDHGFESIAIPERLRQMLGERR